MNGDADTMELTEEGETDSPWAIQSRRITIFVLTTGCLIAPIVSCFIVVMLIVGPIRGTYWLTDGLWISAVLNALFGCLLLFFSRPKSRCTWLICGLVLNFLAPLFIYGYFMISLIA